MENAPLDVDIWLGREIAQRLSSVASVVLQAALPRIFPQQKNTNEHRIKIDIHRHDLDFLKPLSEFFRLCRNRLG